MASSDPGQFSSTQANGKSECDRRRLLTITLVEQIMKMATSADVPLVDLINALVQEHYERQKAKQEGTLAITSHHERDSKKPWVYLHVLDIIFPLSPHQAMIIGRTLVPAALNAVADSFVANILESSSCPKEQLAVEEKRILESFALFRNQMLGLGELSASGDTEQDT